MPVVKCPFALKMFQPVLSLKILMECPGKTTTLTEKKNTDSFTSHSSVCNDDFIKVKWPRCFLVQHRAQQVYLMYKHRGVGREVLEKRGEIHTPLPEVSAGKCPAGRHQGCASSLLLWGSGNNRFLRCFVKLSGNIRYCCYYYHYLLITQATCLMACDHSLHVSVRLPIVRNKALGLCLGVLLCITRVGCGNDYRCSIFGKTLR